MLFRQRGELLPEGEIFQEKIAARAKETCCQPHGELSSAKI
jgi:hypothetical protein